MILDLREITVSHWASHIQPVDEEGGKGEGLYGQTTLCTIHCSQSYGSVLEARELENVTSLSNRTGTGESPKAFRKGS